MEYLEYRPLRGSNKTGRPILAVCSKVILIICAATGEFYLIGLTQDNKSQFGENERNLTFAITACGVLAGAWGFLGLLGLLYYIISDSGHAGRVAGWATRSYSNIFSLLLREKTHVRMG